MLYFFFRNFAQFKELDKKIKSLLFYIIDLDVESLEIKSIPAIQS